MINIKIINIPDSYKKKAEYIFGIFSQIMGIPIRISDRMDGKEKTDILYTPPSNYLSSKQNATIIIPFDDKVYHENAVGGTIIEKDGFYLYTIPSEKNCNTTDLIASSFRLLTFMDEKHIPQEVRDQKGIFTIDALSPQRKKAVKIPLIENHANYILKQLIKNNPNLKKSVIPRWPNGKKYVISITHDTDAVHLGSPMEILTNISKYVIRKNDTYLKMVKDGWRYFRKDPTNNPLFGFSNFHNYEYNRNIQSCFYLFCKKSKIKFHINDCKSTIVEQRIDWNVFKKMAEDGWEFGFHASINAKDNIDAFIYGKHFLEEKLGVPVYGIRHHYWALDWLNPYITFRKHVNAGFRYDTSIAWKDSPGFRASTCLPFQPFDPIWNKPLNIYEISASLMDGHIIRDNDISVSVQSGQELIRIVKEYGGIAVLDWHQEAACNRYCYENYMTVFNNILEPFWDDSDAWFATPWEIVKHWHKRASELIKCSQYV